MKTDNVEKFIEIAKKEGVSELKYEDKEFKLSISFSSNKYQTVVAHEPSAVSSQPASAQVATANTANEVTDNFHVITSPFVGTFYLAPSPGKPNFVNTGDKVSNGETLCILEAMKIMNEIESDVSGEIVEICVENESVVEFGQNLFKIRK